MQRMRGPSRRLLRHWSERWPKAPLSVARRSAHLERAGRSAAILAYALLALLSSACGGDTERDPRPPVLTGCERYCALREQCGQGGATCSSECGWLDQKANDLHPNCGEAALLGCALDDARRVECSQEGLTLELAGCPKHHPGASCALGFEPARGAFQLSFAEADQGSCPWVDASVAVGQADLADGGEPDGLQQFLKEAGEERVTIADRSVECSIAESADGFALALSIRDGSRLLELNGVLGSDGTGGLAIAYAGDSTSPRLESPADAPCSVAVRPSPTGAEVLALSTRFVWADIDCSLLASATASKTACAAGGAILFENCSQL